jgi:hypothetical protein
MVFDPRSKRSISQQIESAADYHPPAAYRLLNFYHSLEIEKEPLDGKFFPESRVPRRSPAETKIFAIGLVPPAVSPGRLLDRSESVRAIQGSYADILANHPDASSSSTGDLPGETSGLPTSTPVPVGPKQTDSTDFFDQYVAMCNRLGCQPEELAKVIQSESGWDPTAKNSIAKGLFQLVKTTACGAIDKKTGQRVGGLGMSEEEYAQFEYSPAERQLFWMEKFFKGRAKGKTSGQLKRVAFGGFNNPDHSLWHGTAKAQAPDFKEYKNAELQRNAYQKNKGVDKVPDREGGPVPKGYITIADLEAAVAQHKLDPYVLDGIQKARARMGMGPQPPMPIVEDAYTANAWVGKGAKDANSASKTTAQLANKDLNTSELGKQLRSKQEAQIAATQEALDAMANTPPLRMMVNPQSFRVSSEKLISEGNWGRNGPIIEVWGDQQDKIEGSGKIAAFYSVDASSEAPSWQAPLSRTARQFSASYQNFLSLFMLYKNNGGVWLPDYFSEGKSHAKNLSVVGSVYLYFDNILYIGSFDSLSVNETDTAPFTLEYSFSFTVRAWYLLDHFDDSQYTYGQPRRPSVLTTNTGGSPLQGGNNAQTSASVALPADTPPRTLDPKDDPIYGLDGEIDDNLEGI